MQTFTILYGGIIMNNKSTITLETDRLVLRKFTVNDVEDMFNNRASNPSVTRFMTWQP